MFAPFSRFRNRYTTEVQTRLETVPAESILREEDLANLPGPVNRYLHYAGVPGKPRVWNFRAECTGRRAETPVPRNTTHRPYSGKAM